MELSLDQMTEMRMVVRLGYLSEVLRAIQSVFQMESDSELLTENYLGHLTEMLKAIKMELTSAV